MNSIFVISNPIPVILCKSSEKFEVIRSSFDHEKSILWYIQLQKQSEIVNRMLFILLYQRLEMHWMIWKFYMFKKRMFHKDWKACFAESFNELNEIFCSQLTSILTRTNQKKKWFQYPNQGHLETWQWNCWKNYVVK